MVTLLREEIKRVKPGSILFVDFGYFHRVVGYARVYESGLSLVPGEKGVPLGPPHPYERIKDWKELKIREVQSSDLHAGDKARITVGTTGNKREDEYQFRVVGFVRDNNPDSLLLATGKNGFPSAHPHSDIKRYEILEE